MSSISECEIGRSDSHESITFGYLAVVVKKSEAVELVWIMEKGWLAGDAKERNLRKGEALCA